MAPNSLPPHAFSRSPVDEVCCSLILNDEKVSFTVPAPYPGWESIRNRLVEEIAVLPDGKEVSGCSLIYRDRFLLEKEDFLRFATGINTGIFHITQISDSEFRLFPVSLNQDLHVCIRTCHEAGQRSAWILTFIVEAGESHHGKTPGQILSWFDVAHAVIHTLFDQIVPTGVVEQIR